MITRQLIYRITRTTLPLLTLALLASGCEETKRPGAGDKTAKGTTAKNTTPKAGEASKPGAVPKVAPGEKVSPTKTAKKGCGADCPHKKDGKCGADCPHKKAGKCPASCPHAKKAAADKPACKCGGTCKCGGKCGGKCAQSKTCTCPKKGDTKAGGCPHAKKAGGCGCGAKHGDGDAAALGLAGKKGCGKH